MLENIFSWDTLWYVLLIIYVPGCLGLIIIVLLQKGKGAGFGGSFGMGSGPGSETVFGPRAGQTLPVKITYVGATIFIAVSLGMSLIAGRVGKGQAPELIDDAGTTISATTGLEDLGLGSDAPGSADATKALPPDTAGADDSGADESTASDDQG